MSDHRKEVKTMSLFEVAKLEHPTPKEIEEGKAERLVFGPEAVVAATPQAAAIAAVLDSSATHALATARRARMEVLVRPFVTA